ncbi:MAG: hypothetical protein FWD17_03305 [Polyangiaceae bacterium]|nr:hypothetical protein [Polyangiaceae bacterium]
MTADSHPPAAPLAIRITRPFATEDEYLEHELETLTRASITLIGAQPRAEGVLLRFELVLASGHVLLRGEGRVTGFRPNAQPGVGGLSLRFTRLDTRSKALIDKAAALREQRRPPLRQPSIAPESAQRTMPQPLRSRATAVPPPLPARANATAKRPIERQSAAPPVPSRLSAIRPPASVRAAIAPLIAPAARPAITPPPTPAPLPAPITPPPTPAPLPAPITPPPTPAPSLAPITPPPLAPVTPPPAPITPPPAAVISPPAAVMSPPALVEPIAPPPVPTESPEPSEVVRVADPRRDGPLDRLRERARALSADVITQILDLRRSKM